MVFFSDRGMLIVVYAFGYFLTNGKIEGKMVLYSSKRIYKLNKYRSKKQRRRKIEFRTTKNGEYFFYLRSDSVNYVFYRPTDVYITHKLTKFSELIFVFQDSLNSCSYFQNFRCKLVENISWMKKNSTKFWDFSLFFFSNHLIQLLSEKL